MRALQSGTALAILPTDMRNTYTSDAHHGESDRTASVLRADPAYTLVEVLVAVSVFGIITAIAAPQFRSSRVHINNAYRLVLANLRLARTSAISKSLHYQVSFPSVTQIQVSRMKETPAGSGTWQVDTTNVQTIPLPTATQVASTAVGSSYEFNSRGIAVNLTGPQRIDVKDTFGVTKSLQVWPSGQVNEL